MKKILVLDYNNNNKIRYEEFKDLINDFINNKYYLEMIFIIDEKIEDNVIAYMLCNIKRKIDYFNKYMKNESFSYKLKYISNKKQIKDIKREYNLENVIIKEYK
ncbi:MAG: hypothetical protein FH753_03185 [Firmicutes bacterium]|nr:hypothetical protein [Bacillota bacterium]